MELQERRKRAQADARRLAQAKAKAEADAREKAAEARKRKLDAVAKMDRAKETERLHAMNAATELESSRRVAAQQARDRVSDEARLRAEAAQAKMLEAQQKEEALAQALEEKKERLRQEKKQLRKAEDRRRKSMGSANSFADEAQRLAAGRRERMGLPSDPEEDVGGGTATPSARKAAAAAAVIASPRRRAAALAAAGDGDGDAEAEVEAEAEAEATSNKLLFSPPSAANAPTPEPEGFFSPPSAANAPTPDLEFEPSNQSPVRGGVQTTSAMARATKGWVPKKINDGISAESELAKRMRESKTRRATFLKEFQIDDDTAAAAAAVPPTPVAAVQGYEAHTPTPSTPPPPTTATASTTPSASASFAAAAASPMSAAGTPPVGGRTNQFRKSRTGGTTPLPTPRTPTSTGETWQQKLKREKEAKLQSFATVSSIVTSPLKQEKAQPGSLIARVSVQHRGNTVIRRPKSIHDDMSQTEDFTVLASKIKAKKLQRLKEEAEARKSPHQKAAARARPRRGSVRDIAQDHAEVLHVHAASALPPPRVSWQSKLKQERAAKAAAEAEQLVRDQEKAARNSAYLLEKAEKAEKASKAKSKYLQSMGAR